MRNVIVSVLSSFLLLFVIFGVFAERALAGKMVLGCSFTIAKSAGETDTFFNFLVDPSDGGDFEIQVVSGGDNGFVLDPGESAVVSEIVPDGWRLVDVTCESEGGFSLITGDDNNVFADCVTAGVGVCTFTNVPAENIPTLSDWGIIAAAAGLVLVGVLFAVRRKRVKAV